MKKQTGNVLSRRDVMRTAAFGAVAAPFIVPSRACGANNRIRVGQIGCGRIAQGHDMPGVIVATSPTSSPSPTSTRAAPRAGSASSGAASRNAPPPTIGIHQDYRELLARTDIDAVTISLPITSTPRSRCAR